jgi:5-methylcytosine-specific restriction protein A
VSLRPCLGYAGETCGQLTSSTRCPTHRRLAEQARGSRHQRGYDNDWDRLVAALKATEPWCHNRRCPYRDAGTQANPLTGQHIVAKIRGGTDEPRNVTVWCRRCNSAEVASLRTR